MSGLIEILRVGPQTTIQDQGRPGYLKSGISASGPMDQSAYCAAGALLSHPANSAIEFTTSGLDFRVVESKVDAAFAGGAFNLTINGQSHSWPHSTVLNAGDKVSISPGAGGNYGYVRFSQELDVPKILGSRATNLTAKLGGLDGRALSVGDKLKLDTETSFSVTESFSPPLAKKDAAIRFVWGVHADRFSADARARFLESAFVVSTHIDRMGARLEDPDHAFAGEHILSLVSDAVVPGDIQILGDGTPIVLLRDHQPTGGYPRIGTIISADLDRFVQMRPHQEVRFEPVTVQTAHAVLMGKGK